MLMLLLVEPWWGLSAVEVGLVTWDYAEMR
jgi:hypothetical protein